MKGKQGQPAASSLDWVARLKEPTRLTAMSPLARRFIFSLRLVAVYRRAKRDPLPELTSQLGNVTVAVKALQLIEALAQSWPEPLQVRRCCCEIASHDELTMAGLVDAAVKANRDLAQMHLSGLLRPERIDRVWEAASELIASEYA